MSAAAKTRRRSWRARAVLLAPYLWLAVFFLAPFIIVLKISLSQTALAQPPYLPALDLAAGWAGLKQFFAALSLDTYALLASDSLYLLSYLKSLEVAAISTAILLIIGYPIAYGIARCPRRLQPLLVMFVVLPLYATLEKMDETLLEAAADLGCPRWKTFWLVTVPLALPGMAAGMLLCFIPIVGEFVIPDLLGGSENMMIGQTLWMEFFSNKDWPVASAIAVALLCLLLIPMLFYERLQQRQLEGAG